MKNLLNYQSSEYDCGPVSIINGIRYLFEREEIYPEMMLLPNSFLVCLHLLLLSLLWLTGSTISVKSGTSPSAVMFYQAKRSPLLPAAGSRKL